ncbi:MAG: alpha/beta hydrolase [Fibrobacter sp.]|nr:alpha/beta hydrolase [Fibrobacter sp.]
MIEYLLKQLLSFVISVVTLFSSESRYQQELENMPTIPERVIGKDLSGWKFSTVLSKTTNEYYYYFEYPVTNKEQPVLLCIHGFNTDATVFFKMKSLSDKYRIIALNMPDRSSLYQNNISDFEKILDDFCTAVSIDTISLLGYSVGGGIALNYAATTTKVTVNHLILISTTIFGATEQNKRQMRGMADRLLRYPDYKLYALLIKGSAILKKMEKPEVNDDVPKDGIVIKHVDWYKQILKSFYWYDASYDARRIKCKVSVIHGKNDKVMNIREIDATKKALPDAAYFLLDNAAHSLVWSHAQNVDEIIRPDGQPDTKPESAEDQ